MLFIQVVICLESQFDATQIAESFHNAAFSYCLLINVDPDKLTG